MIVVLANVFFMLALLYFMCSETFKENKDNAVVKEIRKRTSKIKRLSQALSKIQRLDRHATQHSFNPSMDAHLKEIELIAMAKEASIQEEETTMGGKKKKKKNRRNSRATVAQNRQEKKKQSESQIFNKNEAFDCTRCLKSDRVKRVPPSEEQTTTRCTGRMKGIHR